MSRNNLILFSIVGMFYFLAGLKSLEGLSQSSALFAARQSLSAAKSSIQLTDQELKEIMKELEELETPQPEEVLLMNELRNLLLDRRAIEISGS